MDAFLLLLCFPGPSDQSATGLWINCAVAACKQSPVVPHLYLKSNCAPSYYRFFQQVGVEQEMRIQLFLRSRHLTLRHEILFPPEISRSCWSKTTNKVPHPPPGVHSLMPHQYNYITALLQTSCCIYSEQARWQIRGTKLRTTLNFSPIIQTHTACWTWCPSWTPDFASGN